MARTKVDLRNPIYHDDDAARQHLEMVLWPQGPVCPRCGVMGERITKLQGKSTRPGVYKCKDCRKPFRTNAPQDVRERCYYVRPATGPHGLEFMVENGTIARIDVKRPGILTEAGAQIGTPEAELKRLYGSRLGWMPHKYVDRGHYAEFSPDKTNYLIFETDGRKVTVIRAGRPPAVRYVEGCL